MNKFISIIDVFGNQIYYNPINKSYLDSSYRMIFHLDYTYYSYYIRTRHLVLHLLPTDLIYALYDSTELPNDLKKYENELCKMN